MQKMLSLIVCKSIYLAIVIVLVLAQLSKQTALTYTIEDGGMTEINCTNNATSVMINHETTNLLNANVSHNDTLIIRNPRESQIQGLFNASCISNGTVIKTFLLRLLKAPIILTKGTKRLIIENEHPRIFLACEATGYPEPGIEWRFGNRTRNASQNVLHDKVIFDTNTNILRRTSYKVFNNGTLQIVNPLTRIYVPYEDFTCVAQNTAGTDSRSHQLFIDKLIPFTFEVELKENISVQVIGKIENALRSLSFYDFNITHVNTTRHVVQFKIRLAESKTNNTLDVQTRANMVYDVLDDVVAITKFIMNGMPGPPTNLQLIDVSTSEITFSWKHPKYFIIDHYQIQTNDGFSGGKWRNHALISGSETSFTLTNVESDTKYLIKMYGLRESKKGKESRQLTAETKADIPVTIIVVVVVIVVVIAVGLAAGVIYYKRKPQRPQAIISFNPYEHSLPGIDHTNIYTNADITYCPLGNSTAASQEVEYSSWREIPRDSLAIGEALGSGEFGLVLQAIWSDEKSSENIPVAVKVLKGVATETDKKELLKELMLMSSVSQHPNIVNLIGACSHGGDLHIVIDFCENGQLLKFLRQPKNRVEYTANTFHSNLDVMTRMKFANGICNGMCHLEASKIVHRDLAARNVLLAQNNVAKVSDFGLSRDIYELGLYEKTTGGKLPVKWMAIESLQEMTYTSKSDVWSFAVTLWEIESAGMTPYPGLSGQYLVHHLKKGVRLNQPTVTPSEVYDIMMPCWQDDPATRPSFRELNTQIEHYLETLADYLPVIGADNSNVEPDQENVNDKVDQTNTEHNDTPYLNTNLEAELAAYFENDKDEYSYVDTDGKDGDKEDEVAAYVNQDVQVDDENTMTTTC